MKTISGVYTSAVIFNTDTKKHSIDDYAIAQIQALCDNKAFEGCKVRVMPDVHPGKAGTIGFTSMLGKRVLPSVIGIDIGCGITIANIKGKTREFQKLDTVIREHIPSGFAVRREPHRRALEFDFASLRCYKHINEEKALLSLGTLGGGNHFIELDAFEQNGESETYFVVHTGSRHLGKEVTEYYLKEGQKVLKESGVRIPYELTYLEGNLMEDYLHDIAVVQEFAACNREIILTETAKFMKWKVHESVSCTHNYVDFNGDVPILRKGAISAKKGEKVVIPINMRDGVILGTGLGNEEWNQSAPHGAGRIRKRQEVMANFTLSSFKKEMEGIYSTCIRKDTLDEAPFAYRDLKSIVNAVKETITIDRILHPVYNFKAGGR